jgi:4-amino-4-deoxy-L-arabinose transferase-like glycosyltransferase
MRFGRILLLIVLAGFGIRLAYVGIAKAGPCPVSFNGEFVANSPSKCTGGNDQIYYNTQANALADGRGYNEPLWNVLHPDEDPPPAADHPPLTVLVLTPVSWLVEHPPLSWFIDEPLNDHVREHRYSMVVLGTLLLVLIGLFGRRIGGDAVGWVAAAIAAINPNIWVNDGLVMSETVTALTVVGALWAAFEFWRNPTLARAAFLGFLCGLAALARAELLLFVPLLGVVIAFCAVRVWADRAALAVAAVGMSLLTIAPWVAFNQARFEERTFLSTNDGTALAGSNCDRVYSGRYIGLWTPGACLEPTPTGDQSEAAKEWRSRAFEYMGDHLDQVPWVVLARVGRLWSVFRPGDMIDYNTGEDREEWVTLLGIIFHYPLMLAAIGGAVALWRERKRRTLWVLIVPAIVVTLTAAATYGQTRFRAAAEPSLALLAAFALVALARVIAHRGESAEPEPGAAPTEAAAATP